MIADGFREGGSKKGGGGGEDTVNEFKRGGKGCTNSVVPRKRGLGEKEERGIHC